MDPSSGNSGCFALALYHIFLPCFSAVIRSLPDKWVSSDRTALDDTLNSLDSWRRYARESGLVKKRSSSLIFSFDWIMPEKRELFINSKSCYVQ